MFQKDHIPILIDLPNTFDYADIYFIHDVHYGSPLFDNKKWEELKKQIIENDKAYVCWVGDLMENAIPNSKSDMFTQSHSPSEQKEWVIQQFKDLADKTLAVVPGNHEKNRTTKVSGLYPLYDCCLIAGIDDKYRNTIAFLDIGIGTFKGKKNKQVHYYCGSFCLYGGYGSENAYRPQSDKMYKLRIYSNEKRMETTGFYIGGSSL